MKWVTRIQYGSSAADILTTIGLAQNVRDLNFLPFIGGWYSHYDWPGSGRMWFQFLAVHRRLTFSLRLAWLSMCVIWISYRSSAAVILTTIGLAQAVCDLNFLPFIGGWHSLYDWPGSVCTWFQFLTIHRRPTFSLRLTWLREYAIWISYRSSAADILTTTGLAQGVRDLNFLPFIGGWHFLYDLAQDVRDFNFLCFIARWHCHFDWSGSESTWFQFLMVHRRLTFSLRLAWFREYVISISYRSSAADILTAIGPDQIVRDFNFLWFLGGWRSHCDWSGSDRTWFQFLMVPRRLMFSLRSPWLRPYVISIR